jgi:uncharacterized repeat protein (TIGR01451 family)
VQVAPERAVPGQLLTWTFALTNNSQTALEDLVLRVTPPVGTSFERAAADETAWSIDGPSGEQPLTFQALGPLAPDADAELILAVRVETGAGPSIVLDDYVVTATQLTSPLEGSPVRVQVQPTPSPTVMPTATASPSPTTLPSPTATAEPTATHTPTPPPPTPTATVTLAVVELPPSPTATPNLSPEQVSIGTATVLIFVGIVLVVIVLAAVWVVRASRQERTDAGNR